MLDKKINGSDVDTEIKAIVNTFTSPWEKFVNQLTDGLLHTLLQDRGISITSTSNRLIVFREESKYEFDIVGYFEKEIIIVRVVSELDIKAVDKFVWELENIVPTISTLKTFKVYGCIAFLSASNKSTAYAMDKALFTVKAIGNTAVLLNAADFIPRKF